MLSDKSGNWLYNYNKDFADIWKKNYKVNKIIPHLKFNIQNK
jgi:hypothetical protein